jgi:Type IV secretory system Conjugative DNA transfer
MDDFEEELPYVDFEDERAKNIRNNHFVQIQASKFNSVTTVHDYLISNSWEIAPNIEYPTSNVTKYIYRQKYICIQNHSHSIFVFLNDDNDIYEIRGLRDGMPKTAFDCLVALRHDGDDYAAALAIYRKSKKPSLGTAFYFRTPTGDIPAVHHPTSAPLSSHAASYPIYPTFQPSTYGIADWMKFEECLENDLFSDAGIPLGFVKSDRDNTWYGLYYSDERHLITVAPNGTGKGTCAQKPVLLLYHAPMLVIDPKGENAAVTAKYRKEGMKHDVLILNPFNVLDEHFASEGFNSKETDQFESACFNPLAALNPKDDNFVSDVASLAEALVDTVGKDPFWR